MATPVKWGKEFRVNTTVQSSQLEPVVKGLANGRFLVTWDDYSASGADTSAAAVRGQLFTAAGVKLGDEFVVNTNTTNNQNNTAIAELTNGRYVVAWTDRSQVGGDASSSAIKSQIYNANGTTFGSEFLVNSTPLGEQVSPALTGLSNGRFVAVWQTVELGQLGYQVRGQVYSATGQPVGGEFFVKATNPESAITPEVTPLANGRFVVTYTLGDGTQTDIRAKIFNSSGIQVGVEILVTSDAPNQNMPVVTTLADGRFVIAWADNAQTGTDTDSFAIKAQVYNANGTTSGSLIEVNTTTAASQLLPSVAALQDGRFVIAWQDLSGLAPDSGSAIRAQVFNVDGTPSGTEFLVNTTITSNQSEPNISVLADGRFVVTYRDPSGGLGDGSADAVLAQIFDPREAAITLDGTSGHDDYVGTAFNDTINGLAGNDRLNGAVGADTLTGGIGKDIFEYDSIADSTVAAAGRDTIIGFDANAADRIDLRTIDAISGPVNDNFTFVGGAAFAGLGQVRVFQSGGNTFVDLNTTGNNAPDMRIKLDGLVTLDAADFIL